jgi:lipoyl(octanoyl) transferase
VKIVAPVSAPRAITLPYVRHLGLSAYAPTWQAMREFTAARTAGTPDEIWLTEHPPIYTLGLAGRREHLLRQNGIEVLKVDRGGQVTYHGPGQLVVYALLDLARAGLGIRDTVRRFERAVIRWLETLGIDAYAKPGAPGVYTLLNGADAKIAALGLKVSRGCTYHGLSVNVAMDLSPFSDIDPCGYRDLAVTQLRDLGVITTVDRAGTDLTMHLGRALVESHST